jgi:CspA family cold shock protein
MNQGTVKWFNDQKCFDFISCEDGSNAFVHHTSNQGDGFKSLAEGDAVSSDTESGSGCAPDLIGNEIIGTFADSVKGRIESDEIEKTKE